jgi:GT2 family glycosyltransferase
LDSLKTQTQEHTVVVVENGSTDGSDKIIEAEYPDVILIKHKRNLGFTGGVNAGIKRAMEDKAEYVALLNNDAVADKHWLGKLVDFLEANPKAGIVTSKICDFDKTHLDSTGDLYTIWGLPFPRGRGQEFTTEYDNDRWVFGASGGASLYRVGVLEKIGIFDNDFFAYYEDLDLSFRAQLAGWKVGYEPWAMVYHEIGATSSAIKGFATYQTLKNLPQLFWKNVPWGLMLKIYPRFWLAYYGIAFQALRRRQYGPLFKGLLMGSLLSLKKLCLQRHSIQKNRKVPVSYINAIITHDLPPNARRLRNLRAGWWKLRGKHV